MKRVHLSLFSSLLILIIPTLAHAQAWSGIIHPSRAIDWTSAGVVGGIPARSGTPCATINPEGRPGAPVPPTDVNAAIASCANSTGKVVYLNPGSYYFNAPIIFYSADKTVTYNNVTLRGAGADKTLLYFFATSGENCDICIKSGTQGYYHAPAYTANWTAGYSKGTTSITLDNVTNIKANSTVLTLDQCNDGRSGNWVSDSSSCGTGADTDTGSVFNCSNNSSVCTSQNIPDNYRTHRGQEQQVLVTAVSGSGPYTVTISPALYASNWTGAASPGAWWPGRMITGSGVEDLSVDGTNNGSQVRMNLAIYQAYGCWIKGVRSLYAYGEHIEVSFAKNVTLISNYFYGHNPASGDTYGNSLLSTSDSLIANNIITHMTGSFNNQAPIVGNVFVYNFVVDTDYFGSHNWDYQGLCDIHNAGDQFNLNEGGIGPGCSADEIHGTHNLETFFRNRWWGQDYPYTARTQNSAAAKFNSFSRMFNVIGNIIGFPGWTTTYADAYPSGTNARRYDVYFAGYGEVGSTLYDSLVWSTMFRWGNYDVVTGAVRWCGNSSDPGWSTTCSSTSEVPTGLSSYANAVPASTTLPASFYFSSQPSFWSTTWGTPPWPAIGPDVTSGKLHDSAGYANMNPAGLVWTNSPVDTSYQQTYTVTGATCSSGTATVTISGTFNEVDGGTILPPEGEFTVSGITPSGHNGTYLMSNSTTSTVSYAVSSCPSTYSTGGTVKYPNIRLFNEANYSSQTSTSGPAPPTGLFAIVQ
jgi:hypothetical protein